MSPFQSLLLLKGQLEACKTRGAIINEYPTINSIQSTISPPPFPQSNNAQTSSAPPAQENVAIHSDEYIGLSSLEAIPGEKYLFISLTGVK